MTDRNQVEIALKGGAAVMVAMAGAAQAQDLQGLYGGLSYSKGSGEACCYASDTYSFDGNASGAFLGYNHVFGDWLFGAELAFSSGDYESFDGSSPFMDLENVRDIKARVGRVFGSTLVYGVVGRSTMDVQMWGGSLADGDATATAYGLGFETGIGSKGFVGGEYLKRDLDLSEGPAFYANDGANLDTLSLRVGLRF